MKTREEIMDYLIIYENTSNLETFIESAMIAEKKYNQQLENGEYGYGLECDFDSRPYVLESEDFDSLKEVERINGVVVYERIKKGADNYDKKI